MTVLIRGYGVEPGQVMEQGQRCVSTGTTPFEGMLTQLLCGPLASAPGGDFRPAAAPAGAAQVAPAGPKLKAATRRVPESPQLRNAYPPEAPTKGFCFRLTSLADPTLGLNSTYRQGSSAFVCSAARHSRALHRVGALHASVPLHRLFSAQKAFSSLALLELFSLPGLSLNTTSSVKPPEACQPQG